MTIAPAPSAFDTGAWKAWIAQRARLEMPALLRSSTQRSQQIATTNTATRPLYQPETGAMRRLDTEMISAIKLLPVDVRDTKELVSEAVCLFYRHYDFLPSRALVNPMRQLGIDNPTFFPLEECCADFGCYTISVCSATIESDVIGLWGRRLDGMSVREDYPL